MKRAAPALAIIMLVLLSVNAGPQFTCVFANFMGDYWPHQAISPKVTVITPTNRSTYTGNLNLIFSIEKPVEWEAYGFNFGEINSVGCQIDGNTSVILDKNILPSITGRTLTYSTILTGLSAGEHSLTAYANGTSEFMVDGGWDTSVVSGSSSTIYFSIRDPWSFLSMPEEYINYTITPVNGTMMAKIDGTYPIHLLRDSSYTPVVKSLLMIYPIPPDTINISVRFNETELVWSNYTETNPDMLHHTALGDWSMIQCTIQPSDFFVLEIHYEHPIEPVNGSYSFLYDLNITPYLSPLYPNSTAYFSIRTEFYCLDLKVLTVPSDNVRNPVDYTIKSESNLETITFNVTSEYSKPIPGDLVVVFRVLETFPTILVVASTASVAIICTGLLIYFKKRKSISKSSLTISNNN